VIEAPTASAAYLQLLSVGLVWISFHCAGMCGPLLIGFDVAGAARGVGALRGAAGVLTYQAGRAVTYLMLGAAAGLVGRGLTAVFEPAGSVFALVFGTSVVTTLVVRGFRARAARRPRPVPVGFSKLEAAEPTLIERLVGKLPRTLHPLQGPDEGRHLRIFGLGAAMGLLPCMITYWVLGLAATTGSPLHGALLMLLLVAMTTPMLLGVTLLPRLLPRRIAWLPQALMALSATWLILIGLAGLEVIAHLHFAVGDYMVMLW
jgi:sulfite exporter TauE/SafE